MNLRNSFRRGARRGFLGHLEPAELVGGASGLTAADPGDRTGWSVYESKSGTVSWVTYPSSGALRLSFSTLTWRSSDDSTGVTGFKKTGYSSSRIQSSGEGAHLRLQTADPVWTSSPTLGSLPGMFDVKAAAGDLDGDGDQDLMWAPTTGSPTAGRT